MYFCSLVLDPIKSIHAYTDEEVQFAHPFSYERRILKPQDLNVIGKGFKLLLYPRSVVYSEQSQNDSRGTKVKNTITYTRQPKRNIIEELTNQIMRMKRQHYNLKITTYSNHVYWIRSTRDTFNFIHSHEGTTYKFSIEIQNISGAQLVLQDEL